MSTRTLPAHLPHPFSPVGRAEPFESYRWLRENDPVHFDPASRSWFLVAHSDCASALSDIRFSAALGQQERERDDALPASMLTTDAPDHARLRGLAHQAFTPRMVERLRGRIQLLADDLLAAVEKAVTQTGDQA